jgi:hypothetical protein
LFVLTFPEVVALKIVVLLFAMKEGRKEGRKEYLEQCANYVS